MKIEPRGKYAGVKVHLDGEESEQFLQWAEEHSSYWDVVDPELGNVIQFACSLGRKIKKLMKDVPNLLQDRTEDQIAEALERDKQKILQQQAAMKQGSDWKQVK